MIQRNTGARVLAVSGYANGHGEAACRIQEKDKYVSGPAIIWVFGAFRQRNGNLKGSSHASFIQFGDAVRHAKVAQALAHRLPQRRRRGYFARILRNQRDGFPVSRGARPLLLRAR